MTEKPIVVEARCRVCGRRLTDPESVKAGIGPVCAEKLKRPGYFVALSPDTSGYALDENVVVLTPRYKFAERSTRCDSCGKENPYSEAYHCPYCGAPMIPALEVVPA